MILRESRYGKREYNERLQNTIKPWETMVLIWFAMVYRIVLYNQCVLILKLGIPRDINDSASAYC